VLPGANCADGGVTSICMKPPGVELFTRICVPVCGVLTLNQPAW
jgi:hypothetical protein